MKTADEKQLIVDVIMELRAIFAEKDDAKAHARAEALVDKIEAMEGDL